MTLTVCTDKTNQDAVKVLSNRSRCRLERERPYMVITSFKNRKQTKEKKKQNKKQTKTKQKKRVNQIWNYTKVREQQTDWANLAACQLRSCNDSFGRLQLFSL